MNKNLHFSVNKSCFLTLEFACLAQTVSYKNADLYSNPFIYEKNLPLTDVNQKHVVQQMKTDVSQSQPHRTIFRLPSRTVNKPLLYI